MDQTTTQMCKAGYGRLGFARVLIDVEAEKGLPDRIDIIYKNRDGLNYVVRPKTMEEFMEMEREDEKKKQNKEEFEKVRYKRKHGKKLNQNGVNKIDRKGTNSNTVFYKPMVKESTNVGEENRNEVEQKKMIDKEKENECESLVEEGIEKEKEIIDVYDETSGLGKVKKQKVVKELIVDENVSICAILETRLKGNKVKKIGERLFGRWNWYDNSIECSRGCRILVGWDSEKIQCSIISGKLMKKLWNDLNIYKAMINDGPYVIMGDLNVSLNLDDHSEGISSMTQDMEEFKDVLKKIDRVMGNEEFLEEYFRAHAVFLPYGISNHSPVVLTCPQSIKAKSRSFRFANYIADKDDFLNLIKDKWKTDMEGYVMFKLAKKLKSLKPAMNKLNYKNGNLFENVKKLKKDLDEVQTRIDVDPTNSQLREQCVGLFKEYTLALEDEEKSNRCRVEVIFREDNVKYTRDQVPIQFVKHFQMFLGEQNKKECLDLDDSMFSSKIDNQEACRMINEVSNKEIKEALFDIDDNKAPGPDSYTAKFFK
ncbi:RNA-directed DNA polymerase, eukaryota, reverse transcriptase zinc-binding domain protein [Tanacetum coccineum]